mgnify:CR=1 FL=1
MPRSTWWRVLTLTAIAVVCGVTACDRGSPSGKRPSSAPAPAVVEPTSPKPEYYFAAGLERDYPDVVAFLRQFMETSLAGDYAGYRRLVSRATDPESRARFERVLNSLRSLTIQEIKEIDAAHVPQPTYLVISQVDLLPEHKVALRRADEDRIAILVFPEEGELRMTFAPAEMQPLGDAEAPVTAPATSQPSYPWEQDADY